MDFNEIISMFDVPLTVAVLWYFANRAITRLEKNVNSLNKSVDKMGILVTELVNLQRDKFAELERNCKHLEERIEDESRRTVDALLRMRGNQD